MTKDWVQRQEQKTWHKVWKLYKANHPDRRKALQAYMQWKMGLNSLQLYEIGFWRLRRL